MRARARTQRWGQRCDPSRHPYPRRCGDARTLLSLALRSRGLEPRVGLRKDVLFICYSVCYSAANRPRQWRVQAWCRCTRCSAQHGLLSYHYRSPSFSHHVDVSGAGTDSFPHETVEAAHSPFPPPLPLSGTSADDSDDDNASSCCSSSSSSADDDSDNDDEARDVIAVVAASLAELAATEHATAVRAATLEADRTAAADATAADAAAQVAQYGVDDANVLSRSAGSLINGIAARGTLLLILTLLSTAGALCCDSSALTATIAASIFIVCGRFFYLLLQHTSMPELAWLPRWFAAPFSLPLLALPSRLTEARASASSLLLDFLALPPPFDGTPADIEVALLLRSEARDGLVSATSELSRTVALLGSHARSHSSASAATVRAARSSASMVSAALIVTAVGAAWCASPRTGALLALTLCAAIASSALSALVGTARVASLPATSPSSLSLPLSMEVDGDENSEDLALASPVAPDVDTIASATAAADAALTFASQADAKAAAAAATIACVREWGVFLLLSLLCPAVTLCVSLPALAVGVLLVLPVLLVSACLYCVGGGQAPFSSLRFTCLHPSPLRVLSRDAICVALDDTRAPRVSLVLRALGLSELPHSRRGVDLGGGAFPLEEWNVKCDAIATAVLLEANTVSLSCHAAAAQLTEEARVRIASSSAAVAVAHVQCVASCVFLLVVSISAVWCASPRMGALLLVGVIVGALGLAAHLCPSGAGPASTPPSSAPIAASRVSLVSSSTASLSQRKPVFRAKTWPQRERLLHSTTLPLPLSTTSQEVNSACAPTPLSSRQAKRLRRRAAAIIAPVAPVAPVATASCRDALEQAASCAWRSIQRVAAPPVACLLRPRVLVTIMSTVSLALFPSSYAAHLVASVGLSLVPLALFGASPIALIAACATACCAVGALIFSSAATVVTGSSPLSAILLLPSALALLAPLVAAALTAGAKREALLMLHELTTQPRVPLMWRLHGIAHALSSLTASLLVQLRELLPLLLPLLTASAWQWGVQVWASSHSIELVACAFLLSIFVFAMRTAAIVRMLTHTLPIYGCVCAGVALCCAVAYATASVSATAALTAAIASVAAACAFFLYRVKWSSFTCAISVVVEWTPLLLALSATAVTAASARFSLVPAVCWCVCVGLLFSALQVALPAASRRLAAAALFCALFSFLDCGRAAATLPIIAALRVLGAERSASSRLRATALLAGVWWWAGSNPAPFSFVPLLLLPALSSATEEGTRFMTDTVAKYEKYASSWTDTSRASSNAWAAEQLQAILCLSLPIPTRHRVERALAVLLRGPRAPVLSGRPLPPSLRVAAALRRCVSSLAVHVFNVYKFFNKLTSHAELNHALVWSRLREISVSMWSRAADAFTPPFACVCAAVERARTWCGPLLVRFVCLPVCAACHRASVCATGRFMQLARAIHVWRSLMQAPVLRCVCLFATCIGQNGIARHPVTRCRTALSRVLPHCAASAAVLFACGVANPGSALAVSWRLLASAHASPANVRGLMGRVPLCNVPPSHPPPPQPTPPPLPAAFPQRTLVTTCAAHTERRCVA